MTETVERKVQALEIDTLGGSLRLLRPDRLRIETIEATLRVDGSVTYVIEIKQQITYGNVKRMKNGRLLKRYLNVFRKNERKEDDNHEKSG